MSKLDYKCYGDVVNFDATCCTYKCIVVCNPFICVNNHWRNAMGNKPPKTFSRIKIMLWKMPLARYLLIHAIA
ncbi:hypothetical protein RJ639_018943, partial [Escallonia herrerae]